MLGAFALRGRRQALDFGRLELAGLADKGDLTVALGLLAAEEALDIGALALALLADERDVAVEFLELGGQRAAHLGLLQLRILGDEGDLPLAVLLLARQHAADLGALQLLGLGDERDLAVALLLRAGERAADFRGLAALRFLDDGDVFLDLRRFERLLLADLLLLDLPASVEHVTLLLAQDARALVGNLLLLLGGGDRFVAIDIQDAEAGLEAAPAHRERGFLARHVALIARALFGRGDCSRARDLGLLPLALLGGEIDVLVALGALAREVAADFGDFRLARLVDQLDLAVLLRLLDRQTALDALLLERQLLLHLHDLAPLRFGGDGDVALGAQLLERLLVLELLLLDGEALVEHEGLLLAQLLGLLVGDLLVLAGARHRLLAFDLQEFELGGEVLLADRDRGLLLGGVHLAPRLRGDLGDDLETFGIEHVVGAEILLGRLLQRDDGHLLEHQAVGDEAFADALLDLAGKPIAVLMQLLERLGGGKAAQGADHLRFEQVAHLVGIERLFPERAAGGEDRRLGVADVRVKFSVHVDADVVGREDRLFARPADRELDRFQRDPGDLMKDRKHDGALAQAHFGAEEAGADEAHVGGRSLVDPDRDDVEDRDKDHRDDEQSDYELKHRALAPFVQALALPAAAGPSSRVSGAGR